jgi:hypothetical protein
MILATHAIGGAAVAIAAKYNPVAAFFLAFLSHFALDAIPHWEYQITSRRKYPQDPLKEVMIFDKKFIRDLAVTGGDCLLGAALSIGAIWVISPSYLSIVFLGVIGGVLPDFLQLVYFIFPKSPLRYLQLVHSKIQSGTRLNNMPLLGITLQIAISVVILGSALFFI